MQRNFWIDSKILNQKDPNMPHIAGPYLPMEKDSKWHHIQTRALLLKKSTKIIKSMVGTMFYYTRSVDQTMLRAINEILRVQSRPTRDTTEKSRMLLEYAATYPNAILDYKVSDMVLHVDSDAAYLTMPEERSCYSGHFYLSNRP